MKTRASKRVGQIYEYQSSWRSCPIYYQIERVVVESKGRGGSSKYRYYEIKIFPNSAPTFVFRQFDEGSYIDNTSIRVPKLKAMLLELI